MPPLSTLIESKTDEFLPPPYPEPHVRRQLDDLISEVADAIPPVWPLKDYVAVNPYLGLTQRPFLEARSFLKLFSDCETLMPLEFFAREHASGGLGIDEIEAAVDELTSSSPRWAPAPSADRIVDRLNQVLAQTDPRAHDDVDQVAAAKNQSRAVKTIAEHADALTDVNWSEAIVDEISKHCAAHYDEGQAVWTSPWRDLPLYQAWRSAASVDRNIETLGLSGLRQLVSELPHTPDAAIVYLLERLQVPPHLWRLVLLCQAFSVPGWTAWAKYQDQWSDHEDHDGADLASVLAMRLAYDVALSESLALNVDWVSIADNRSASFETEINEQLEDAKLRLVLLRAMEIGFRDRLLDSLAASPHEAGPLDAPASQFGQLIPAPRKLAQMVFCIDVRSERIRRQLESTCSEIETFGFAGFFGMPIEFVKLGQESGDSHVPVLLKPQFQLHEGLHESDTPGERHAIQRRGRIRTWRKLWKAFQTSAVGCFSFVETTGLWFGWKLWARTAARQSGFSNVVRDGLTPEDVDKLGPTLRGLNHQDITTSQQAELAESMLRNLGLVDNFARLVVFCGHASRTENNPLAASLDCGACGGHSGEPNARMAAMLLNQPYIRKTLADRGLVIPDDTHFLGGLHNTTTDEIEFFDLEEVPESHLGELDELIDHARVAGQQTRVERMPKVASESQSELLRRARDWSEVRPEWGLAGNAAFIVGPRWMTRSANLDGRSFLHSYDSAHDPDGSVLETIMTAPMIVAHWINMQYYASVVDHHHFGSGNKTVHNVVGQFGILSGNGGDLMTGLPWQSLHNGSRFQHQPLRLQAVIAAPRSAIENVIANHELVADLLANGWLHLVAIDDGQMYRYTAGGEWQAISQHANTFALQDQ